MRRRRSCRKNRNGHRRQDAAPSVRARRISRWSCRSSARATAPARPPADLAEHPWAGVDVDLTLVARDEAGNEGRSEPFEMRMPERALHQADGARADRAAAHSRARRRAKAARPDRARRARHRAGDVQDRSRHLSRSALDLLATHALAHPTTLCATWSARLWDMAVFIEDGNVSDAEAALRAAQEALRQALERGASDEEIKRLTDQLRAALDKFLQALAEELRKNPQQLAASARSQCAQSAPAGSEEHDRPARTACAFGRQGCRPPAARGIAVDAGKSADGAAGSRWTARMATT